MSLRLFLVLFFTSVMSLVSYGQQVRFEVINTPEVVAVGEVFRIEFNVNTTKPDKFTPPKFKGINVIAGPSEFKSTEIINGNRTDQYSFVYVVSIDSAGTYTIPPAEISFDGKSYKTKEFKIKAIVESNNNQQRQSQETSQNRNNQKKTISSDDVVFRLIPSKSTVYRGEPIIVSIKLYTRVPLSGINGVKLAAFNGFWTQRIDDATETEWVRETFNGKIYNSATVAQYLLYPQNAGKIEIEQCAINVVVQKEVERSRTQSIFDMFDMPMYETYQLPLKTKPVTITVKELPAGAPAGFNGAVGQFSISADINPHSMSANSAGTYTLKLSGTGNMSTIQAPKIEFPQTFEVYNAKVVDKLQNSLGGTSGTKHFEYPFIPRAEGDYTIAPFKFSYFDTAKNKYVTLSTESFDLKITADLSSTERSSGLVSGISKEDLKILGEDIRYINTAPLRLMPKGYFFVGTVWYFVILALIILAFVVTVIIIQRTIKMRGNQSLMKGRAAGKRALKRFKKAESDMTAGNEKEFYAEMLRALWGYISDKLDIPQSQLTKENILEKMTNKGISNELGSEYMNVISECEFAQYAPVQSSIMRELFDRSSKLIVEIESKITTKK